MVFDAGGERSDDGAACADDFSDAVIFTVGYPDVSGAVHCDICRVGDVVIGVADGWREDGAGG
jgi:hypothetical protein